MTSGPFFQYTIRASQADQKPALLEQRDRELEDYLARFAVTTPWTAVTFQNSWVNYGSALQEAQYRKVGDMVHLRGSVKTGTSGTVAFTLPEGFRPPATVIVPANGVGGFYIDAALEIASDGTVTVHSANTALVSWEFQFSVTP